MTASAASIFDMDGLLVDSEILWHRAELEILVPLGAAIDADATRATKGMFVREVVEHYHDLASWDAPGIEEVVDCCLARRAPCRCAPLSAPSRSRAPHLGG